MRENECEASVYSLNIDQVKKINMLLPRGYKVISIEDFKKRVNQSKKKAKVIYQPISEILPLPQSRRVKQEKSYYEGDDELIDVKRNVYFDAEKDSLKVQQEYRRRETQKIPKPYRPEAPVRQKSVPAPVYTAPAPAPLLPVMEEQYFNNSPLTPKQIVEELQKHPKFRLIQEFSERTHFDNIVLKIEQNTCTLQDIIFNMQKLFISMYSQFPRKSDLYTSAAELQSYLNNIIDVQKSKLKEVKSQKIVIADYSGVGSVQEELATPELNRQQTNQQKKKSIQIKPDLKNITIMDKRLLGQNIKKLPPDYLQEICRIAHETIQTREEYIIEIDTMPLKKVKQLQIYVSNCIQKIGEFQIDNQDRNDQDSSESSFIITDDDD